MEYSGQYLTYEDYKTLGGTLAETSFNLLEFEARRKIDEKTFGRLREIEYAHIPQEVKLCEYNLINSIESYSQTTSNASSNGNVASENTDGYSVSYINATQVSDIVKSKNAELKDIIRTYLLGIIVNGQHIMYCGVE